ncbi:MAG: TraR/DksA C4-type zinc finger protein [Steroidobacteraceae bacterium]
MRRLDQGRYTSCAVCGEPIEDELVQAVPYTDRCRTCVEGVRRRVPGSAPPRKG